MLPVASLNGTINRFIIVIILICIKQSYITSKFK